MAAATQEVHDLKRLIDGANAPIFGINAAGLVTEWNSNPNLNPKPNPKPSPKPKPNPNPNLIPEP